MDTSKLNNYKERTITLNIMKTLLSLIFLHLDVGGGADEKFLSAILAFATKIKQKVVGSNRGAPMQ